MLEVVEGRVLAVVVISTTVCLSTLSSMQFLCCYKDIYTFFLHLMSCMFALPRQWYADNQRSVQSGAAAGDLCGCSRRGAHEWQQHAPSACACACAGQIDRTCRQDKGTKNAKNEESLTSEQTHLFLSPVEKYKNPDGECHPLFFPTPDG